MSRCRSWCRGRCEPNPGHFKNPDKSGNGNPAKHRNPSAEKQARACRNIESPDRLRCASTSTPAAPSQFARNDFTNSSPDLPANTDTDKSRTSAKSFAFGDTFRDQATTARKMDAATLLEEFSVWRKKGARLTKYHLTPEGIEHAVAIQHREQLGDGFLANGGETANQRFVRKAFSLLDVAEHHGVDGTIEDVLRKARDGELATAEHTGLVEEILDALGDRAPLLHGPENLANLKLLDKQTTIV